MDRSTLRLLYVDDHVDSTDVLGRVLRGRGYQVTTATSYAAALRLCETQTFDILLTDLALPDGNGLDLLGMFREKCGVHVRGIVFSGFHDHEDIRRSERLGFDQYLLKPADIAEIEKAIGAAASRIVPHNVEARGVNLHI